MIRDLPEQLDPIEFAEYLKTHKITHLPQLHSGEAVFQVNSEDDAHAFLELVGGKYKNKKIVLSVEEIDYQTLSAKRVESNNQRHDKN